MSHHHQLREERTRRNWRQQDVADKLGTTVVTISRWEQGIQLPSAYFRIKLCELFGKSAEELGLLPDVSSSPTLAETESLTLTEQSSLLITSPSDPLDTLPTTTALPLESPQIPRSIPAVTQLHQNRAPTIYQIDFIQDTVKVLLVTKDPAEKAAIIADLTLGELPKRVAFVARRCIIFHWFDQSIVEVLLKEFNLTQDEIRNVYEQLKALPFIENLPWGLAFQDLTREGLLKHYAPMQDDLLTSAALQAASVYEIHHDDKVVAEAAFCYVLAGNKLLSELLIDKLTEQALARGDQQFVDNLQSLLNEARQISLLLTQQASYDHFGLELFRRAIVNRDDDAWESIYQQYTPLVLAWVTQHHGITLLLGPEDSTSLVKATFAKFSQALTPAEMEYFASLEAILKYLKMCVHSIVDDEARSRQNETTHLPAPALMTSTELIYPKGLTPRELDVLRLLAQGLTNRQIAERLVIGVVTVNFHVSNILIKLGVNSRAAATRQAIEHGLV